MKSISQMVVLVTIVAAFLPFTAGLPARRRLSNKFVGATDPSQKTGNYIVLLKEGRDGKSTRGPNFMSVMYQGLSNYMWVTEEDYSQEVVVKKFQDLGFFMYSVDMNNVALKKVLKCKDVAMVEEDSVMMTPSKAAEEEDESSGYGDDSYDEDEDGGGMMFFG